jgi:hypothetical protein
MAIVGAAMGFFAKRNLQVAGLTLNIIVLIPSAIMMALFLLGMVGAAANR